MAPIAAEFRCPALIETERLRLRPPAAKDVAAIVALAGEWEIARFIANIPHPYAAKDAQIWIAAVAEGNARGSQCTLALANPADDALIGAVGVLMKPDRKAGTLGYWLGRPHWGRGLMTEAVARMLRVGFEDLDLERIEATHHPENHASARVLEKAGLAAVGTVPQKVRGRSATDLETVSLIWCALDRAAWRGRRAERVVLVAAAALVDADGRVLIAQRPPGKTMAGLWEFPGGKVKPGETPERALIRELKEELGIDISESCLGAFAFASHGYADFHLLMPLYLCRKWQGTPRAREHTALKWARPEQLAAYPMPPADKPLVAMLRDFL